MFLSNGYNLKYMLAYKDRRSIFEVTYHFVV